MAKIRKLPRAPKQSAHVPPKTLAALTARDGHKSAWTGRDVPELVPQHRQGGMGGRRGKHALSNLVWLESEINGLIESDANFQAEAVRRGIKVSGFADPRQVPVLHAAHDGWVRLDDDGNATKSKAGA